MAITNIPHLGHLVIPLVSRRPQFGHSVTMTRKGPSKGSAFLIMIVLPGIVWIPQRLNPTNLTTSNNGRPVGYSHGVVRVDHLGAGRAHIDRRDRITVFLHLEIKSNSDRPSFRP